jgi:hypothetical protein
VEITTIVLLWITMTLNSKHTLNGGNISIFIVGMACVNYVKNYMTQTLLLRFTVTSMIGLSRVPALMAMTL